MRNCRECGGVGRVVIGSEHDYECPSCQHTRRLRKEIEHKLHVQEMERRVRDEAGFAERLLHDVQDAQRQTAIDRWLRE